MKITKVLFISIFAAIIPAIAILWPSGQPQNKFEVKDVLFKEHSFKGLSGGADLGPRFRFAFSKEFEHGSVIGRQVCWEAAKEHIQHNLKAESYREGNYRGTQIWVEGQQRASLGNPIVCRTPGATAIAQIQNCKGVSGAELAEGRKSVIVTGTVWIACIQGKNPVPQRVDPLKGLMSSLSRP